MNGRDIKSTFKKCIQGGTRKATGDAGVLGVAVSVEHINQFVKYAVV